MTFAAHPVPPASWLEWAGWSGISAIVGIIALIAAVVAVVWLWIEASHQALRALNVKVSGGSTIVNGRRSVAVSVRALGPAILYEVQLHSIGFQSDAPPSAPILTAGDPPIRAEFQLPVSVPWREAWAGLEFTTVNALGVRVDAVRVSLDGTKYEQWRLWPWWQRWARRTDGRWVSPKSDETPTFPE